MPDLAPDPRACLYCGDLTKPKTAEHVLQRALGGSMTLTEDVCGDCNTVVFGPLDDELVRFLRPFLATTEIERRHILRENLVLTYDEAAQCWSLLRLGADLHPTVCPQVAFRSPTTVSVMLDQSDRDAHSTFARMVDELGAPDGLRLEETVIEVGDREPKLCPIVVRTAARCYLLVGENEAAVADLRQAIMSGQMARGMAGLRGKELTYSEVEQPRVVGTISRDFGAIERAMVKTAINYVCKVVGPDVARAPEIAALRAYALSGGESPKAVSLVRGKEETFQALLGPFCGTERHALALISSERGALVVQLLNGTVYYLIALGAISGMPVGMVVVTTFDHKKRTHEVRTFKSIAELAMELLRLRISDECDRD